MQFDVRVDAFPRGRPIGEMGKTEWRCIFWDRARVATAWSGVDDGGSTGTRS